VLVADEGFDGVVIRPGAGFRTVRVEDDLVKAGAGAPLAAVVHKATEAGLGGLEFCAGIPGTVGGAVVGNAGGKEGWIGERVVELTVVTAEGDVKVLPRDVVNWSYRYSSLKGSGSFLTRVLLRLPRGSKEEIRRASREYWDSRKGKQPLGKRNAGSTFKNPPGQFAGKLLEEAGMKGFRSGGAVVSGVHANFINHEAEGTARDVVAVMREAQKRVLEGWKIRLEPEILPLGDWKWKEVGDVWWNLPQGWFR
jgi:UDP-N-acetylmuramate dehydrogenase